jgi:hypothetical protein
MADGLDIRMFTHDFIHLGMRFAATGARLAKIGPRDHPEQESELTDVADDVIVTSHRRQDDISR